MKTSYGFSGTVSRYYRADGSPPTVSIQQKGDLTSSTPSFAITAQDSGSGVQQATCLVDDLEVACGSTLDLPPQTNGQHRLTVLAVDHVGQLGTSEILFTVGTPAAP